MKNILEALLNFGVNINYDHGILLTQACKQAHYEIVKYIVDQGGDLHANAGRNLELSLHNFLNRKVEYYPIDPKIFFLLIESGANLQKIFEYGGNPDLVEFWTGVFTLQYNNLRNLPGVQAAFSSHFSVPLCGTKDRLKSFCLKILCMTAILWGYRLFWGR